MELSEWAHLILSADTIEGKLFDPGSLSDLLPGKAVIWNEPVRPSGMGFSKKTKENKLPPFHEHSDPYKIAICLHRFAGHELLAVEIMAYTLLAFPNAPPLFRRGLAHTLREEQGHVKLYIEQMKRLGVAFGDMPLYKHFWKHTSYIKSPKDYVSMMSLTFEMANLDFAPMYGRSFANGGDLEAAALMATILEDEIVHVKFGWNWLQKFKNPLQTPWESWKESLEGTLLTPKRARGFVVQENYRKRAGIPVDWIDQLKTY